MWVKAVEKAGTTDPDAVIDAIIGVSVPNLTGGYSPMMPNHHITKPVLIGEIQADGQFEIVWQTTGLVVGDEWSDYLPDSKDLIADWRAPMSCGNFNVATGKCGGKGDQLGRRSRRTAGRRHDCRRPALPQAMISDPALSAMTILRSARAFCSSLLTAVVAPAAADEAELREIIAKFADGQGFSGNEAIVR